MSARQKLNGAYLTGSLVVAGMAGLLTRSWEVLVVLFGVLAAVDLVAGNLRPSRRQR